MSKYILIILIILCVVPLNLFAKNKATDAGSVVFDIGTVVDFTTYTGGAYEGDNQATDITIGSGLTYLNCSYFIIDNLAVGGEAFFNSYRVKGIDDINIMISIGPTVSYYIPIIGDIYLKTMGEATFTFIDLTGYISPVTQFGFGFGGGIINLLTPNLGIYGMMSYTIMLEAEYEGEPIPESGYNIIAIEVGLSIFL